MSRSSNLGDSDSDVFPMIFKLESYKWKIKRIVYRTEVTGILMSRPANTR